MAVIRIGLVANDLAVPILAAVSVAAHILVCICDREGKPNCSSAG